MTSKIMNCLLKTLLQFVYAFAALVVTVIIAIAVAALIVTHVSIM